MLACLVCSQAGLADPLHKFGPDGGYRHESSGWIFPRHVAGLERVDAPIRSMATTMSVLTMRRW